MLKKDVITNPRFQIRQCIQETCGLRFSIEYGDPKGDRCPQCHAPTVPISGAQNYGRFTVDRAVGRATGPVLEVFLDNIRSAWNVGSMLRSADGAGVRHVHLCGVSAQPDNPKVAKTALGAEKSLPWTFYRNGIQAVQALKEAGYSLWALEGGERAESLFEVAPFALPSKSRAESPASPAVVLVAGNELSGVDPGILELCERVVCLPMQGLKSSLNVAVAFGIAVYYLRFGLVAAVSAAPGDPNAAGA